jgi:hypothetical protein
VGGLTYSQYGLAGRESMVIQRALPRQASMMTAGACSGVHSKSARDRARARHRKKAGEARPASMKNLR